MGKKEKIIVQDTEITILSGKNGEYISLTDMAGYKDNLEARIVVANWMSTYYTVDFLAVWEQVNNPNFNRMGFHTVRNIEHGKYQCAAHSPRTFTRSTTCTTQ